MPRFCANLSFLLTEADFTDRFERVAHRAHARLGYSGGVGCEYKPLAAGDSSLDWARHWLASPGK